MRLMVLVVRFAGYVKGGLGKSPHREHCCLSAVMGRHADVIHYQGVDGGGKWGRVGCIGGEVFSCRKRKPEFFE